MCLGSGVKTVAVVNSVPTLILVTLLVASLPVVTLASTILEVVTAPSFSTLLVTFVKAIFYFFMCYL